MGEAADALSASPEAAKCCCSHGDDHSDGGAPQSPGNGAPDNGADCLCGGAIMDGVRAVDPEDMPQLAVAWMKSVPTISLAGIPAANITSNSPRHFPPLSTGRDVCALICTRLL
jgi:hypothetical protein